MKHLSKYEKIRKILSALKQPNYRYSQITEAIFKNKIRTFEAMNNLPKPLRNELIKELGNNVLSITPKMEQKSNQVSKILFAISGNEYIESVRLSYKTGWESYCISSQCGCGFGCTFCATGTLGLKRNLTTDEITDQLLYFTLNKYPLDSVSFMGMGEALANPYVFDALHVLTVPKLFGLGHRRITVSTIGLIPGIKKLTKEFPQINLTFSLHSPFNDQRSELMPINNHFPLEEVLTVLDEHIQQTKRKVYIAYILLRGINDSTKHAEAVADLLRSRGSWEHLYHVNLIPYNSTDATSQSFAESDQNSINMFLKVLKSKGIHVTVRTQFGSDINAACGQLHGSNGKIE
ncbi:MULTISPECIES: Cfr family 23S rRNA (adenine(2503)-C(8))-methyltransferase [Paenibacillus]|uniref:Ribosomal RNA large subunit methyltransferase Cfr n=2 Tax=Paenibacillus lactis TaxID=228574 RepID=G4HC14_9BACL|nr:Cfr family 23S rRNA (adenine(2503)-C(8))-methyltransferase [Paenibacillus lactis]EHB66695.1 radical SAM enzyme, Cfr family [Paenibacillus lactis 154]MBP1893802.1 23S rRNA (adenine-C8)-methyltransferase [Paenibacillus lactis]